MKYCQRIMKHVCPPKLKCHCDLDFRPRNPKFSRCHLLVMTNHHTKLEDPWAMSFLVIDQTRFVYRRTDLPTDGLTDMCKAIYPHFFKGEHKKLLYLSLQIFLSNLV